jgi:hypothetical protein
MSHTDILIVIFLPILFFVAIIGGNVIRRLRIHSDLKMILAGAGAIFTLALYSWLVIGVPPKVIVIISVFVAFYFLIMLGFMNWLTSTFPSFQKQRKDFFLKRIIKNQKKGKSAKEVQNKGLIPSNKELTNRFGFSEEELKEFGLLDKTSNNIIQKQ